MSAGNKGIGLYPREDLERFTTSQGRNAYHSAEEWVTDEEATERNGRDGQKIEKLICVEKWWRGPFISQIYYSNAKLQLN